jgi:lysine-N-methylase
MSRFRCITDRCEATCCAGLKVSITAPEWRRVQEAVARDPEAIPLPVLAPESVGGTTSLWMPKHENGHCIFQDPDKLCGLHRRHGEAVLPKICVTFPRATVWWDTRLEMAGSLSCPEVARLCLLAEDAMQLEPIDEERVGRPEAAYRMSSGDPEAGWGFHATRVRATALGLLRREELPLTVRLMLIGRLALRLHPFYFRETEAFRGEGRASAEARLAEVLQSCESPEVLEAARGALRPQALPSEFFAKLYTSTVQTRLSFPDARLRGLLEGVQDAYGGPDAALDLRWRLYLERRERLERTHGERVRQYFAHHALNHWLEGSFTPAPSVLVDVFLLALTGGVMRWLLMGHPEVVRLCEEDAPRGDESQARLDRAAVECFQLGSRYILGGSEFMGYALAFANQGEEDALATLPAILMAYGDPAHPAR